MCVFPQVTNNSWNIYFSLPCLPLPDAHVWHPHMTRKVQYHILPYSLCPNVLASHCFLAWLMPFGIHSMNNELACFPDHAIACHWTIMSQSVNREMLSNYLTRLICFSRCFIMAWLSRMFDMTLVGTSFWNCLLVLKDAILVTGKGVERERWVQRRSKQNEWWGTKEMEHQELIGQHHHLWWFYGHFWNNSS